MSANTEYNYFRVIDLNNGTQRYQVPVLEPVNITLCGKIFADVIKIKVLRQEDYPGLSGWTLNAIPYTGFPYYDSTVSVTIESFVNQNDTTDLNLYGNIF